MSQAWFKKQQKVFIAYADETNENQFFWFGKGNSIFIYPAKKRSGK